MSDQHRRFGQGIDSSGKVGDVIINAELIKAFTPRTIAMAGEIKRMTVVSMLLKIGNEAHIPALGMAITAVNKE